MGWRPGRRTSTNPSLIVHSGTCSRSKDTSALTRIPESHDCSRTRIFWITQGPNTLLPQTNSRTGGPSAPFSPSLAIKSLCSPASSESTRFPNVYPCKMTLPNVNFLFLFALQDRG